MTPQPLPRQTAHDADKRPFISVVIPTFRRPDIILRAIDSVLAQDFQDWELIVSDDEGPTGKTWEIVSELARSEFRIRLVENFRGKGQVENTNNAMLSGAGRWIKPLHDDDWLAPGALSTFAMVAERHPSAAFLTCAVNSIFDDRVKMRTPPRRQNLLATYSSQECLKDLYLVRETRRLGIVPSTLLINAEVVRAGCLMRHYMSISYGVDQLFFIDLACRGDMIVIRDGLVFYDATSHPSITATPLKQQRDTETLHLKRLIWSLLEDTRGLPSPETVARALRIARLPGNFRQQPLFNTVRDLANCFHPSIIKLMCSTAMARANAISKNQHVLLNKQKRTLASVR